jgi:hypothetical protein
LDFRLEPNKAIPVPYPIPPSQLASVRVVADRPVNVFVVDEGGYGAYRNGQKPPRLLASSTARTEHAFQVRLPVGGQWYLLIENPWPEHTVNGQYYVNALTFGPASSWKENV